MKWLLHTPTSFFSCDLSKLFKTLLNYANWSKSKSALKSKMHIFPFTCNAVYQSVLFLCRLWSVRVSLLLNIIILDGTLMLQQPKKATEGTLFLAAGAECKQTQLFSIKNFHYYVSIPDYNLNTDAGLCVHLWWESNISLYMQCHFQYLHSKPHAHFTKFHHHNDKINTSPQHTVSNLKWTINMWLIKEWGDVKEINYFLELKPYSKNEIQW